MRDNTIVLVVATGCATALGIASLLIGQITLAGVAVGAVAGMLGGHLNGSGSSSN